MTERPHIARWRDKSGLLIAGVVLTALCWILGNPRSSGPDEPSHMIASAGLVRGDREGRVNPDPNPNLAGSHLHVNPLRTIDHEAAIFRIRRTELPA